ncbi:MAG: hypothetical protein REI11_18160 [Patulibacter sp.]|nr:hypothetical protein [Patulibacter sp.]
MSPSSLAPELDLLRAFVPGGVDTPEARGLDGDVVAATTATDAARDDARAQLLDAIAAERDRSAVGWTGAATPTRRRLIPGRRLLAGVGALGGALVLLAVGIGDTDHGASPEVAHGGGLVRDLVTVPTASASDALRAAAAAAVGQPTVPFTKDTRWVVRSERAELMLNRVRITVGPGMSAPPPPKALYAAVRVIRGSETTSFDGKVMASVEPSGAPKFTTKASADAYREVGGPRESEGSTYPIIYPGNGSPKPFVAGSKALSYDELRALPTDTPALARWVRSAAGRSDDDSSTTPQLDFAEIQVITGLMLRAPLSPELRAGLWRVASGLPSLKLLGPTKDPAGRTGTGLSITSGDEREEIVFSPQTGMLLSAWIYKTSAVTTCDRDLEFCSQAQQRAGDHGKPWTVLAVPGTVESGTTVLSAAVEPR